MTFWLLILCGAAISGHGAQAPDAALLQRLQQPTVLRGVFVQARQIAGFKRPVESRGMFVVARGRGLLWHTVKPFESLMANSRERLTVTNGGGRVATVLEARREPMLRTINELLQSVVIADIAALKPRFEVTTKLVGESGWELEMKPRDAVLRARFSAIGLAGDRYVQSVRLVEGSGDITSVLFEDQRADAQLTDTEVGLLK